MCAVPKTDEVLCAIGIQDAIAARGFTTALRDGERVAVPARSPLRAGSSSVSLCASSHERRFDLHRVLESKRTFPQKLIARPLAEKLRLLDELRERALVIRRASTSPASPSLRLRAFASSREPIRRAMKGPIFYTARFCENELDSERAWLTRSREAREDAWVRCRRDQER